jgi:hypothetical protein
MTHVIESLGVRDDEQRPMSPQRTEFRLTTDTPTPGRDHWDHTDLSGICGISSNASQWPDSTWIDAD